MSFRDFNMFVSKSQIHPKRLCSTNQLTMLLLYFVWMCLNKPHGHVWACVCVYRAVIRGRVMSVSVLSLLVDPVMVTAIPVSPSEQCCSRTHTDTQRSDIFKCKGNSTVSVKGKANRMGDFKCLPWVTPPPHHTCRPHPHFSTSSAQQTVALALSMLDPFCFLLDQSILFRLS